MPSPVPPDPPRRRVAWLLFLAVGILSCVVAWVTLAVGWRAQSGWLALPVALDLVLMLFIGGLGGGPMRAWVAAAGTAVVAAAANWGIVATQVGGAFGLAPWESSGRLGAGLGWMLVGLANRPQDVAWTIAGIVLGAVAGFAPWGQRHR